MKTPLSSLLDSIMREKKPAKPVKAYSYLRFSTLEQMAGDSKRRQSDLAKRYAEAHGLTLDSLSYQDLGVSGYSGANAKSGKLAEFLAAVEGGVVPKGSYLLVESLDRISRQSPFDALPLLQRIVNSGITLVTLMGEPKVYNAATVRGNPMVLLEFVLIASRAHEESATKQRRAKEAWKASMAEARAGTSRGASSCPAWLRPSKDGLAWEVIPERGQLVKRIFEMAKAGMGKDSIAKQLNAESVPTFGAARWWGSYIYRILTNRGVIGEHTPRERVEDTETGSITRVPLKPIKNYYPSVIAKRLWDDVAAMQRSPRRGRHAHTHVSNVFGGLALCPKCAGSMTRKTNSGPRQWACFVCTNAKSAVRDESGGQKCTYKSVSYGRVEQAFLAGAARLVEDAPEPTAAGKKLAKKIRSLEEALGVADDQLVNLLQVAARASGQRPAALVSKIQEVEHARAESRKELDALNAQTGNLDRTLVGARLNEMGALASKLAAASAEDAPALRTALNALLRRLLAGVVIDYEAGLLRFRWQHAPEQESTLVYAWPKEA